MKKLVVFLKEKLEEKKIQNKVKRVEIALNSAELNFKCQKDDNEIKLEEIMEKFNSDTSVECVITELSKTMDSIEEAKKGLERIKELKKLLLEEETE